MNEQEPWGEHPVPHDPDGDSHQAARERSPTLRAEFSLAFLEGYLADDEALKHVKRLREELTPAGELRPEAAPQVEPPGATEAMRQTAAKSLPDWAIAEAFRDVSGRNYGERHAGLLVAHVIERARALASAPAPEAAPPLTEPAGGYALSIMEAAEKLVQAAVANAQYVWEQRQSSPAFATAQRDAYIALQDAVRLLAAAPPLLVPQEMVEADWPKLPEPDAWLKPDGPPGLAMLREVVNKDGAEAYFTATQCNDHSIAAVEAYKAKLAASTVLPTPLDEKYQTALG